MLPQEYNSLRMEDTTLLALTQPHSYSNMSHATSGMHACLRTHTQRSEWHLSRAEQNILEESMVAYMQMRAHLG